MIVAIAVAALGLVSTALELTKTVGAADVSEVTMSSSGAPAGASMAKYFASAAASWNRTGRPGVSVAVEADDTSTENSLGRAP